MYIGLAKALEGGSKVSGQVRHVAPPQGWYCDIDDNCRHSCLGCKVTVCNHGVCVCSYCPG